MSVPPALSFIVAAYEHLVRLPCLLWSLKIQTRKDFEVLVADNSVNEDALFYNRSTMAHLNDPRFRHISTKQDHCYKAARLLAPQTFGEYLCFPNDDDYYVPGFAEIMLRTAVESPSADLVYCDALFDPRWAEQHCRPNATQQCTLHPNTWTHYSAIPEIGCVSKGGFIVRRELFLEIGWPGIEPAVQCDGLFIYEASRRGAVIRKAPGILWVHN
jgi:hypothetical protein